MSADQMIVMLLFGFPVPPEMIDSRFPLFLQRAGGLLLTLLVTAFSLVIGAAIGAGLALGRRYVAMRRKRGEFQRVALRGLRHVLGALSTTIRAMPIMLLVLVVFYLPYRLVELRVPGFVLAVAAFSLYAGAYLSEILRAGFRSVDPNLTQVGRLLGLTPTQIFVRIEMPIACRAMTPDLINLAVTVFKDTSTLAIVAVPELTYVARQLLTSKPMEYEVTLLLMLLLYWLPATLLSTLAFRTERRGTATVQTVTV